MASEIEFRLNSPAAGVQESRIDRGVRDSGQASGAAFGQELSNAISTLDHLQVDADAQADAVAQGNGNLHEVAIAFEKADVAMRLATRLRNKVVDAYNDIMKMSV